MDHANSVQPEGLAAVTLGITVALGVLALVTVFMRLSIRVGNRAVGLDDYLMLAGLVIFLACCAFTGMDCYYGLGSSDDTIALSDSNGLTTQNGYKWLVFFQITYAWSLPFIKSSICVALLRIATSRRYIYPLWAIMVISIVVLFIGFVAVLINCKPVAASWNPELGSCDSTGTISKISVAISVVAIVTDWSCAIIPGFLLWNIHIGKRQKISLCVVLALGGLASISTIVRLPYLRFYNEPVNYLQNVANIVIWSMIECGVGIIAGSLPALRPLVKSLRSRYSSRSKTYGAEGSAGNNGGGGGVQLKSMGGGVSGGGTRVRCHGGGGTNKSNQWERLDDSSSQKHIMKNTQIDVEWTAEEDENDSSSGGVGRVNNAAVQQSWRG